jgi:signal transduction histidine kinase/ActR/RegA family two-component response regulator
MTFTKVYPLKEGFKSSSGSGKAFQESRHGLSADEYFWVILSHVLPDELHQRGERFTLILVISDLIILLILGLVSWQLVLADAKRRKAEEYLKKANQELEGKVRQRTEEFLNANIALVKEIEERKKATVEKLQVEAQLQQAQKMEAIGTLAGGIAHDFNNLLGIILGYADLIKKEVAPESTSASHLDNVIQAGSRAVDMVKQILTFSRQTEQERGPLQIHLLVREAVKLLRSTLPSTIEVKQEIDPGCGFVESEAGQINQLVMNLCTNAYHAMQKTGGVLTVILRPIQVDFDSEILEEILDFMPGSYVELVIKDTGSGIDPAIIDKIFNPYFSTKAQGEGTGLGLAVVHGIVKNHQGHISVSSEPGVGTEFRIFLPQIVEEPLVETPGIPEGEESGGNERLLVVDDEEMLATLEKRILEGMGYKVEMFFDSSEALRAFKDRPADFDLIITDMTMPHMTGLQLSEEVCKIRSDIPVILCTGYSELLDQESANHLIIKRVLTKPVGKDELGKTIREELDNLSGGEEECVE